MVKAMALDFVRARGMAWQLAVRDIRAQYRQTLLGLLWAFVTPLATTITWVFLNSTGIVKVTDTTLPYGVYVFTGTLLWSILLDAMNSPLQQSNASRTLLAKLNFPREALLLSGLLKLLFNSGIKIVLLLVALVIFGIQPGWRLMLFPLGVFSLMLIGTAVGLLLTPIGMLYQDIGRMVPLAMGLLMYLTPVVFPVPQQGWVATVYLWNPLTPLITTSRDWLTGFAPDQLGYFLGVNVVAFAALLFAWVAWRISMPIIIERMSA